MALDFHEMERKWQLYWEKNNVHKFDRKSKKPVYSIDTPPPTVSGTMHMGHAFAFTQQDFIARYKKMAGFEVFHPFGFDNNGLATALMVEKKKGVKQKNFGREEFIKIVLEETAEEEKKMLAAFKGIGLSVDWSLLYRTIDKPARKIAQYSFLDLHKQGRLYQREAPTMWCPSCATAIAQAELQDREEESSFCYIDFETTDGGKIGIATTRPELMPACVAIHVHPDDKRYKKFVGKEVKIPFSGGRTVKVFENRDVDPEFGTGAVYHCTFGDLDDVEWILETNLPVIEIIDKDGTFNEKAGILQGLRTLDARKKMIEELKKSGHLVKQEPIKHVVNVHERCKTPIEILTSKQWFVKYLDLREEYIARAAELEWVPEYMKKRLDNWINGLKWDWNISRQRHYGIPFPVWYCKKCGEALIAGEKELPVDPIKDKPKKKCKCGSTEFEGEKDTLDTWFTSSLTPQINCKWQEDKAFFKKMFPMDLRPQGHDIIALWAFNTIVKALFHERKLPWKTITINGWALDQHGKKMSKSLGNVVRPEEMLQKYCADALRYWAGLPVLGEDVPFMEKEMVSGKKFITKIMNASRFVEIVTKGVKEGGVDKKALEPEDRAVLSKLNRLVKESTEAFDKYEFSKALNPVRNFFWLEFADFYIEEVKTRAYNKKDKSGKAAAAVLQHVLWNCLLMLAPFLPHTTEEIAQTSFKKRLKGKSIHLEQWPKADEKFIDEKAEKLGESINAAIAAMRKEKTSAGKPMNTEVKKAVVFSGEELKQGLATIQRTMNVKEIELKKGEELKVELEF
ncbi:MAG: valine--tRNA ligase [Candidatus Diapherotrites archaeon]|uniref:Valine--tRNA ligase n=1 Tax=Candidatus Iainarchaeum sp. TaxID=3101447 RepID=A0A939CAB6_9ARCH|nr:valine--tRNA ligase [Candidatus Diapherotrites archaeon]